jgi:hypothetical protein
MSAPEWSERNPVHATVRSLAKVKVFPAFFLQCMSPQLGTNRPFAAVHQSGSNRRVSGHRIALCDHLVGAAGPPPSPIGRSRSPLEIADFSFVPQTAIRTRAERPRGERFIRSRPKSLG